MNKILTMALIAGSVLFVGCAKDEPKKDAEPKDIYAIVVNKSINECKEYNIILDEKRTNDFIRRTPKATIEKAAKETARTPQKLCQFFAEETSLEKAEKVNEFTTKLVTSCQEHGVTLSKEGIHNKVHNLPFFVIKKGLAMKNKSSLEECELMEKKYK